MSIMESMNIGANALKAHGLRLDIHAKNVANVDTPNYVRKHYLIYKAGWFLTAVWKIRL